MSRIVLRFIRSSNDFSKDDTIVVRPVWTSCSHGVEVLEYSVTMTTAACVHANNLAHSYAQVLSGANLRKYLHSLLVLLPNDITPFMSVQLDLPNAPSVIFQQNTLYENAWSILNLVDVTLESWQRTPRLVI